jgi:hypothetical protein
LPASEPNRQEFASYFFAGYKGWKTIIEMHQKLKGILACLRFSVAGWLDARRARKFDDVRSSRPTA